MHPTATTWPIGAALLQFPANDAKGTPVQDADPAAWARVLREVASAGFAHVDLTDTWLRPGDLSDDRLDLLAKVIAEADLGVTAISTVRRSVIDPDAETAEENLAYLLRTIDAAARLGTNIVSVGLHRALTAEQREQLWFWHAPGASDPIGDRDTWDLAVTRLRTIGRRGAAVGVSVSLEMYEDTYLGTSTSAVALVEDINLSNVGLNPDIGNLIRLHRPIEDWEQALIATLPYANYWHVKNYTRDHDPATGAYFTSPAAAEDGLINYRRAIEIALDSDFEGAFCVEHYGGDGLSVSARNREYLRSLLSVKLEARRDMAR